MGFFKDFKDDFSQAVGELFPGDDFSDVDSVQVNTLDNELDVEQELSKLDGLLEQVERKNAHSETKRVPAPESEEKPKPEIKPESEIKAAPKPKKTEQKAVPKAKPQDEPKAGKKDMPEEEPVLAPLVFDESDADGFLSIKPEPKKAAEPTPKPEEKPEAEKPQEEPEKPMPKPEEKPEAPTSRTEEKPPQRPAAPTQRPVEEPAKPASTPVTKPAPSTQRPENRPVSPVFKPVQRPAAPKPEPKMAAFAPRQAPTPAAGVRPQPVPVPTVSKSPVRPAAARGNIQNHVQTNRSVNIKEEKVMDTTVTATETPVMETPAESAAAVSEPMTQPVEITDEVSLITAGTSIRGNMETTGSFEIEGRIEGDIKCNGKLTVIGTVVGNSASSEFFADAAHIEGEVVSSGTVKIGLGSVIIGNISATSAVIAGAVKGDIDVQGPVVVDTSAVIMGNIKSRSVQINNGAVIVGFCSQCSSVVDVESLFDKK